MPAPSEPRNSKEPIGWKVMFWYHLTRFLTTEPFPKKLLAYLLEMDLISVTTFYSDDDKFNKIGDSSVDCMRGPPIDDD